MKKISILFAMIIASTAFVGVNIAMACADEQCKEHKVKKHDDKSHKCKKHCKKHKHKHIESNDINAVPATVLPTSVGVVTKEYATHSSCRANELQSLIGQDKSVLQTMRFGQETRIETYGMAYTMDYRADRLRIQIGEDGKIKRVLCG